jgi:hypothetical protein
LWTISMDTTSPLRIEAIGSMVKRHRCALERGSTVAPAVEHVAAREELEMEYDREYDTWFGDATSLALCLGFSRRFRI